MILAIDTSAAQCAVALAGRGEPVAERQGMDRGHAEHLFPMIEAVLATAGARYSDLTRIAVCTGPGSFTGVRIGVAAARGLALGRGIPVIGISRFEALAAEAGYPVTIRLAGRGGTVYVQEFGADGAPLAPPCMADTTGVAPLPDGLPDPVIIARLAAERTPGALPAPLYLRGADADLPREGPPAILD